MTLSIVVLNQREEFIQFLDPDLCDLKETCTVNGLRTLNLEYKFQDMVEDKNLFRIGNKIWIQGDSNLTDCLYLINTSVKQDIYKENSFTLECEEVLVELSYAPLHSHIDITTENGFKLASENGKACVKIDYNSLNYWFGEFFNIGVVQDCLNKYAQYISVTGTITPMALLRQIEEESGNVFITRYEKDVLNNTIHRYLDFLNPINVSKNWSLHLEYKFVDTEDVLVIYDRDGHLTSDDNPWEITPYSSSMPSESLEESIVDGNNDGEELYSNYTETPYAETWIKEEQNFTDEETIKDYTPLKNLNPTNCVLRISDTDGNLLNSDGDIYSDGDTALQWSSSEVGFTENTQTVVISLIANNGLLGIDVNEKSVVVAPRNITDFNVDYVEAVQSGRLSPSYIQEDNVNVSVSIPDDSYFEIYDLVAGKALFRTCINREIGTVHEEVLDLGFNLENVVHNIDETNTYTAVSPVLELNENSDSSNGLTRTQLGSIIQAWKDLSINKGDEIPMIVQKVNISAPTLQAAKEELGNITIYDGKVANESSEVRNWWKRPYQPQDQITDNANENNTYEFWRATAYWKVPYNKSSGTLYVETDKAYLTEYSDIHRRNDRRLDKGMVSSPKMGTTTSTDEDLFQIYNQVANYLKQHEEPNIDLELDVANLRNGSYNNYQIWDKVYVKIPDANELITARVVEISKEAHDVSKNTIKVSNYKTNTIKTITKNTVIHTSNITYKYPSSKNIVVQLENVDYVNGDIKFPANKLLNFALYKVENGSSTFMKYYTKKTDAQGKATLKSKLNPGDYKIEVNFGGDEEFGESTASCKINVSGKIKTKTSNKNDSKSKTTKKTTKKSNKTTYYDKYGRSPDKKKILAIGKVSASGDVGSYQNYYVMEFQNKCPHCGKKTLVWGIFWAGEHTNYGYFEGTKGKEGGSIEGHIFCTNCDADYSCQGREHVSGGKKLTVTKSRMKSSKSDAYKLKKGKYVYNQEEKSNDSKSISNSKNRKVIGKISSTIKNKSLEIVGNKTGYEALKAICNFMDSKIWYSGYGGFVRSAPTVLKKKHGNCCDQTRLLMELCDGAGLSEYYKMYYVHVHELQGHVYALFETKKTGKRVYIDPASDVHGCYGYVCRDYSHGQPKSRYPTKPF